MNWIQDRKTFFFISFVDKSSTFFRSSRKAILFCSSSFSHFHFAGFLLRKSFEMIVTDCAIKLKLWKTQLKKKIVFVIFFVNGIVFTPESTMYKKKLSMKFVYVYFGIKDIFNMYTPIPLSSQQKNEKIIIIEMHIKRFLFSPKYHKYIASNWL